MATSGLCRKHGLSLATFYKLYGGVDLSGASRLKQLEDENAKLKRLLADAMLDSVVLVTSREVVWLFLEQLRLGFVPAFHRLQGRLAAKADCGSCWL